MGRCLLPTPGEAPGPVLKIPSNVPLPSHPLPPTTRHLALRPTDKHVLGRSPKQPLVCLCIFGLAENSAKSELFSIISYVKVFFSINKYLFSTFCGSVREKAKARRNYVTCPGSSRSLQTEELVFDTGPISFQRQKSCGWSLPCKSPQTNRKL